MKLIDALLMAMHGVVYAREDKESGRDPTPMIRATEYYIDLAIKLDTGHEMSQSIDYLRKKLEAIKNE